jgi:hypothetical protein
MDLPDSVSVVDCTDCRAAGSLVLPILFHLRLALPLRKSHVPANDASFGAHIKLHINLKDLYSIQQKSQHSSKKGPLV